MMEINDVIKYYSDFKNIIDTAFEEALVSRNIELIRNNILKGRSNEKIADMLELLSIKEVEMIRQQLNEK
ncbi:MAG: hypothetical protein V4585_05165 [Bacteroidota bacterium]